MVDIFTFVGFRGGDRPPGSAPVLSLWWDKRFDFHIAYLPFSFDVADFLRDQHKYYGRGA